MKWLMRLDRSMPPERDLSTLSERKAHLVSELCSWETTRRRRRRLAFVALPAAFAVLAATGFTAYALTREPTHLESIGCYDRAALDAKEAVVNSDERDPTDVCGEVWRTGGLGGQVGNIPQLSACVLDTGAVGVFPGPAPKTCTDLGLAALPPDYTAAAQGFIGLRDAIVTKLGEPPSGSSVGGPQCIGEEEARLIVEREFAIRELDWTVEVVGEFTAGRPCADVSFDRGAKTVILVPDSR
jgi:hypothetical protein